MLRAAARALTAPRAHAASAVAAACVSVTRAASASSSASATGLPPARRTKMKPQPGDPLFRDLWRRFQLRVHPDLLSDYPDLQATNAASLQRLQGILNEAKTAEREAREALRPRVERLEFFLRPAAPAGGGGAAGAPPAFLRVPLVVRVAGANCSHLVADALATLFGAAGLPTRFHWGAEFWGSKFSAAKDAPEEEA